MEGVTGTNSLSQTVKTLKDKHNKETDGPLGQQVSAAAHDKNEVKQAASPEKTAKQELNALILKSSLEVSVSAGNEPMSLLFKTAIEGINDALKAEFGDNAIQNAYESGLDVSPEATADRIVSMSTAFFPQFKEQHPDMSDEEAAKKFADVIGGGITTGFNEAKEILGGLNVLEGDIETNIDKTYDLVQDGLKAFVDSYAPKGQEDS